MWIIVVPNVQWIKVAGRSLRGVCVCVCCVFLHTNSIHLAAVFCIQLVFFTDGVMHKQMQNLYYAQIIPEYISHVGTNVHF